MKRDRRTRAHDKRLADLAPLPDKVDHRLLLQRDPTDPDRHGGVAAARTLGQQRALIATVAHVPQLVQPHAAIVGNGHRQTRAKRLPEQIARCHGHSRCLCVRGGQIPADPDIGHQGA